MGFFGTLFGTTSDGKACSGISSVVGVQTRKLVGIWLVVEPYPSEKWWSSSELGLLFPIYGKKKCSKSPTRNKLEGNWEQRTTWAVKAAPWTSGRLEQIVLLHKVFGVFLASQHKGCHFQGIGVQPQNWFRSLLSIQYIHVQYTPKLWFFPNIVPGYTQSLGKPI